jgi:hypothetical protein
MDKVGYDPLIELIKEARAPDTSREVRIQIACALLPYSYPKLKPIERLDPEEGEATLQSYIESIVVDNPTAGD